MWHLFLWHCHWITLVTDANDGIVKSTSGFSLQVYKVNFWKSEKQIFTAADANGYETRMQHWQDHVKSYFIASTHDKSDEANRRSEVVFSLTVEVAFAHNRSRPCVYWLRRFLFWIRNDDNIWGNSTTSGYCPPSWIIGRRGCRPLSVEVVYMRLAL